MKKTCNIPFGLTIVFLATFLSSVTNTAFASEDPKPAVPVELKFAGYIQDQPLFQLNFKGAPGEDEFTITITDESGLALYRETLKGQVFNKKFLLNTDEIGDAMLRFEVFCKKTNSSVPYLVNRNTRVVQDVVIAELGK